MPAELLKFPDKPIPADGSQRSLENAVVRLLKNKPFYGHLLLGFRRRFEPDQSPLGVTVANGTPVLSVNPDLFSKYSPDEQQALLEHGIKHLLHLHPVRGRGLHRLTWDVSTDLAINPSIDRLPIEALQPDRFHLPEGLSAEEYARHLKAFFEIGSLEGEGVGSASEDVGGQDGTGASELTVQQSASPIDNHRIWGEADSTPECLAEQVVRDLVREAHHKAHGEVPEDIQDVVQGWLAPPTIPWRQVLQQFIGNAGRIGRQSTWQRRSNRSTEHMATSASTFPAQHAWKSQTASVKPSGRC